VQLATRGLERSLLQRLEWFSEEADEAVFWFELLADIGVVKKDRLDPLLNEARELTTIFRAFRQTAKRN
jgi:hypothetical protein